ncbi:MAG: hypothetical protein ACN4G0_12795 [Polyangiales bacterium]
MEQCSHRLSFSLARRARTRALISTDVPDLVLTQDPIQDRIRAPVRIQVPTQGLARTPALIQDPVLTQRRDLAS